MVVLAGADGFFGAYLQKRLLAGHIPYIALNHRFCLHPDAPEADNLFFELSDRDSLHRLGERLKKEKEIRLVYLIASHNPDFVRENPTLAQRINGAYYRDFLSVLPDGADITLYYISSDTVYGESLDGRVFTERDAPSPVNLYGEQKLKAEEITFENGFGVVRCAYMFAPSLTLKKHFFDTVCDKLNRGEPVEMFSDYVRNTLSYETAAALLLRLTGVKTSERVFNLCADEATSKYRLGLFAAKAVNASPALVRPVSMDAAGVFTEKRALSILLSDALLKRTLNIGESIPSFALDGDLLR